MHLFYRITISVALLSCGGAQKTPPGPEGSAKVAAAPATENMPVPISSARVLLGWYCPDSAGGRPAVQPILALDQTWQSSKEFLARSIRARNTKRFSVMAYDGGHAGSFAVAGAASLGETTLAIGSYVGAGTCDSLDALGKVRSQDEQCLSNMSGCALAVGELEQASGFGAPPYEEDPDEQVWTRGKACEIGDDLLVDVDGDGAVERFSLSELVAGRVPVELPLQRSAEGHCDPSFAGVSGALIRLGVIDLDRDGRVEVLYRRGQEVFLYGAPHSPARMELLGRAKLQ